MTGAHRHVHEPFNTFSPYSAFNFDEISHSPKGFLAAAVLPATLGLGVNVGLEETGVFFADVVGDL